MLGIVVAAKQDVVGLSVTDSTYVRLMSADHTKRLLEKGTRITNAGPARTRRIITSSTYMYLLPGR